MKSFWAVGILLGKDDLRVGDAWGNVPMQLPDGMAGVLPVYETKEQAREEWPGITVIEIRLLGEDDEKEVFDGKL